MRTVIDHFSSVIGANALLKLGNFTYVTDWFGEKGITDGLDNNKWKLQHNWKTNPLFYL